MLYYLIIIQPPAYTSYLNEVLCHYEF